MIYTADLHSHIDYDEIRDRRHGIRPEEIARAMTEARLDLCAVMEHNKVSERYFDVLDELERLAEDGRKKVLCPLGSELTVSYGGHTHHVGLIFEEVFHRGNLPDIPPLRLDLKLLEEYMMDYRSVSVLCHPAWRYWKTNGEGLDVTEDLMKSGLVDGAEILNGAILFNGFGHKHREAKKVATSKSLEMFSNAKGACGRLAAVGSSDAHTPELIGAVRTEFEADSPEGIFEAVKRGMTKAVAYEQKVIASKVRTLQRLHPGMSQYIGFRKR